jgi:DNA-directed RNA polymerase subunit RPC12/RpoP
MSDRLRFTEEELRRINDHVWSDPPEPGQRRTSAPCPVCGVDCRVLFSWASSGGTCAPGVLIINCDGCGRYGRVQPAEKPCPDFGEAEMLDVVEKFQRGQDAVCPTCSCRLSVKFSPPSLYSAYCLRGGAMGQLWIQQDR